MIIERFRNQDAYQRFRERGRLAPKELSYVGSWVEASGPVKRSPSVDGTSRVSRPTATIVA